MDWPDELDWPDWHCMCMPCEICGGTMIWCDGKVYCTVCDLDMLVFANREEDESNGVGDKGKAPEDKNQMDLL